jgi:hypothetical protein
MKAKTINVYVKYFLALYISCVFLGCKSSQIDATKESKEINNVLDSWNAAAAKADYNAYFSFLSDDAIFTGTDATERWDKKSFMIWAKPIFDKGKAWNFKSLERHLYFDKSGTLAWFEELLNTQMKICRGSGILVKNDNSWKIQQYVLSISMPNDLLDSAIALKAPIEEILIKKLIE